MSNVMKFGGKNILFLLKKNQDYGMQSTGKAGLSNSVRFLSQSLVEDFGCIVNVELCVDANSIDREVTKYKPNVCFLEAIWVTPEKMKEIAGLHKNVQFIIRVHSRLPFLANEGIAMQWLRGYECISNVFISFNNEDTSKEMTEVGMKNIYLPNVYKLDSIPSIWKSFKNFIEGKPFESEIINIGCFCAIRPMKNQLLQAAAAIMYGNKHNKIIRFHVNAGRTEQNGNNVLKNLRGIFENTRHELVEHGWMEHADFIEVIKKMDIGLQVSMSESFNIVAADFVTNDVPIVVSEDISWMPNISKVSDSDANLIASKIYTSLYLKKYICAKSRRKLRNYNERAKRQWLIHFQ